MRQITEWRDTFSVYAMPKPQQIRPPTMWLFFGELVWVGNDRRYTVRFADDDLLHFVGWAGDSVGYLGHLIIFITVKMVVAEVHNNGLIPMPCSDGYHYIRLCWLAKHQYIGQFIYARPNLLRWNPAPISVGRHAFIAVVDEADVHSPIAFLCTDWPIMSSQLTVERQRSSSSRHSCANSQSHVSLKAGMPWVK